MRIKCTKRQELVKYLTLGGKITNYKAKLNEAYDAMAVIYWVEVEPMNPAFSHVFFRSQEIVESIIESEIIAPLEEMGAATFRFAG